LFPYAAESKKAVLKKKAAWAALKLARCPHSLAASLAALPSMSLSPSAPLYLARSRSARPLPLPSGTPSRRSSF